MITISQGSAITITAFDSRFTIMIHDVARTAALDQQTIKHKDFGVEVNPLLTMALVWLPTETHALANATKKLRNVSFKAEASESIAVMKEYDVKRHYKSDHGSFSNSFLRARMNGGGKLELLPTDVAGKLLENLRKAEFMSIAVDESTDRTDVAQLCIYVKFYDLHFREELLGLVPLEGHTTVADPCLFNDLRLCLFPAGYSAPSPTACPCTDLGP
ncbi:unnamed protein product [Pleuronectes platessa]|uniref:DUF4371 domain-containing protein n=1 Tax=Pleuronectes platessa TaxID=8262 RepID=A0A9N7VP31_PLEPL|nr:unnamed protein product [Pleuronectes platessa]